MSHRILARAVLLLAVGVCPGVAAAQPPGRILYNGKIVTVDARFSAARALAIRGERIVAVGASSDIRKLAGPKRFSRICTAAPWSPG